MDDGKNKGVQNKVLEEGSSIKIPWTELGIWIYENDAGGVGVLENSGLDHSVIW